MAHDQSHVRDFSSINLDRSDEKTGRDFGRKFKERKAIMGVFDEGCMGMFNAIIPDALLNTCGVFKERLSQSSLYAEMLKVRANEAEAVYGWLKNKGMTFKTGTDDTTELTDRQIIEQCKMYIAALRLAARNWCDTIGIQYQQGLKDSALAKARFGRRPA